MAGRKILSFIALHGQWFFNVKKLKFMGKNHLGWHLWCRYHCTWWSRWLVQGFCSKCFEDPSKQQVGIHSYCMLIYASAAPHTDVYAQYAFIASLEFTCIMQSQAILPTDILLLFSLWFWCLKGQSIYLRLFLVLEDDKSMFWRILTT